MKFLSSLLLFLSFLTCSFAQDYRPMSTEGNTWIYWYQGGDLEDPETNGVLGYRIAGDSVFNEINYKKVYRQYYQYDDIFFSNNWADEPPFYMVYESFSGLIRDDIENRKVYAVFDEEEILLHDFDVEVGDILYNRTVSMFNPTVILTVTSISDEDYLDHTFRTIFFEANPDMGGGAIYPLREGFGINTNLFWTDPGFPTTLDWWDNAVWFCNGTEEECGIERIISATDDVYVGNEITLSPNPSSGQFEVRFSEEITKAGIFTLSDVRGKTVFSKQLKLETQFINIDLPNGVYFSNFSEENRIIWRGRLIVSH